MAPGPSKQGHPERTRHFNKSAYGFSQIRPDRNSIC
jgi:hypothetical protein